ncbi:hypothetical protein RSOL_028260 [Rhizoctonia solani AG-3 Rhs1AP]|uniref:Uncharacterized protein n=2 Tax=Rhizoctonia solani AG-3 TaxID=1086053 RepID=A0A074SS79_9AGAM|nr:hypothetical protein RSOL_028260 [Rhizoctonia solani AG-3 Rhs1AP]KEP52812.1 hypothetical protein V565_039970 [Rhizoctonia solani 123E]
MPTTKGSLTSKTGTDIVAVFTLYGTQYKYSANGRPNPGKYGPLTATLTYDSIDQLTGSHGYTGQTGTRKVVVRIGNGPRIEADLGDEQYNFDPASTTEGNGTWTSA